MINKIVASTAEAVANIGDGVTVMVGGFGTAGLPAELVDALIAQGARDLTIVSNNAGNAETGLAALLKARRVKKIICSFPRQTDSWVFDALYRAARDDVFAYVATLLRDRAAAEDVTAAAFERDTPHQTGSND